MPLLRTTNNDFAQVVFTGITYHGFGFIRIRERGGDRPQVLRQLQSTQNAAALCFALHKGRESAREI